MSGRQWKPSVTSNLVWVQNKMPVTNPLLRVLGLFEWEALVRSVFQRNREADFNCCHREMILPSLIPIPGILCVCLTGPVQ